MSIPPGTAGAEDCHDRAVSWVQEHQGNPQSGWKEDLGAFRAEAQATFAKSVQH